MQSTIKLDAKDVRRALQIMKDIDPESVKQLRKELRSNLKPIAAEIAREVPNDAPLSGFNNSGATQWSAVRPGVSFRPGKRRGGRGGWSSLLSLEVGTNPKQARGVYIAELAGSRTNGVTPQGKNLISKLNQQRAMKGAGGRYIYDKFRLLRPDIMRRAESALQPLFKQLNRKLR
jgi:hypothetical protein